MRWEELTAACASVDLVISDRWLPRGCVPRWLKLDRRTLEQSGGIAIRFGDTPHIDSVAERTAGHPWAVAFTPPTATPPIRFQPDR